ncbi:succinate-semialdehyde dehydrogenase/glutarate-semialdehyde dehydrogenase [Bradyrhizobium japonicum]|uniref:NAD-dependent succinate-semialdehyde dehydrogenase n=1 Tax=Bradyrhizobium elkanii TaxID=29448 RepID=UPI00036E70F7|nr:NAD-dependent succinate-semialdehyde dehydrogenase [Bradyrhizobium elkanii]MBP2435376.1 succinate-semialdehyde dehydrogenase/glutarate-semialdehyde dehydrogenase [Bradyrhizobium elkanii]MCP1737457.1 succinate-semialdehyde dehydrogenase/glutarate-semialdehyde dehydrogenase [Bradyrhizobium elkanii]MCS3576014.1 succinate-semialdehyde dehydrogenase/glutarate-semialdehyde dehydrogenase [Bradyrhizobium elkanii]MCS3594649.1 succinate-semialdehyde dehydrogenase/glutarate-semialdehyde dehydrogenase [
MTIARKYQSGRHPILIGDWRDSETGATIEVRNPSNDEVIAHVANASVADALAAVDAAAAAAPAWAATSPRQRAEILRKCFELMIAEERELARLIALENGKAYSDALGEVRYAAEFFRWYSEETPRIIGEMSLAPSGQNHILVSYEPVGIAVLVTPWNFPAAMATRKMAPALAAGCTCVLKPATETPLTALAVAEIILKAGVPKGAINVIVTSQSGKSVGAMLHDPRVRTVSFTGSTEVGRILLREAADQVLTTSMELGGNAPFLVCHDANLNAALDGAMVAKMRNGGEACTAANRFYVARNLYEDFTQGLARRMSGLKIGDGVDEDTQLGPMVNAEAVLKIDELVRDAIARVVTGGHRLNRAGHFYAPTVLADVPEDAAILKNGIFGPVAPIVPFDDEAHAMKLANDTEFGLISYLYTEDLKRGLRLSGQMQSGMVALNRGLATDPAAPFGGSKASGLGREGSTEGIKEYLETKYIAVSL